MKYPIIIFFGVITNTAISKNVRYWENTDAFNPDIDEWFYTENEENNEVEKNSKVCQTNECKILGREFLKGMNKSVNPCDDFYDFVCGAWKSNYEIPSYSPVWSRIYMFQQTVYNRIKELLSTEPTRSDILPVRQAKKWYRACMSIDGLEKRGIKPLESILMQVGGWPMTIDFEEWDENGYSWQSIEQHYFHLTGSYIFYDIKPHDFKDDGIQISRAELPLSDTLPFEYRNYTGNKYDDYLKLIENIAQIFIDHNHANVTEKMMKKDIESLVNFEKELYELLHNDDSSESDDEEDSEYETIDEFIEGYEDEVESKLNEKTTKMNFRKLIKNKFDMIGVGVNGSMSIDGDAYAYYSNLTELINKTPKRTIVNYVHWHFVSTMLIHTTEKMRNEIFKYKKNELGIKEREPRWLECIKEIKMRGAESYAFVKKYFSKDVEKIARKMIDNIRKEMKSQIKLSSWMDQDTKDIAIDKLKSMEVILGFPDWYKNKTIVTSMYKGLVIGFDHFDNVLSYKKYSAKKSLRQLFMSRLHNTFDVDPLIVNAMYIHGPNIIELPAADFQPPLFTARLPSVVNYGSVGCVIGHEIGHGFDINGIRYGKDGNDSNISKQLMEMYYKRAECFLDQFNNYYGVTEADYEDTTPRFFERSKGYYTRGENMADSTGLHSVIEAYQKMRTKNPEEISKLPGFEEYTDDQMFFISFGALWCENTRPEFAKLLAEFDNHSPARLRVIGAVSNTNEFAKAFNCPKGSPMNPDNKCNIWKSISDKNSKKSMTNFHHPWLQSW